MRKWLWLGVVMALLIPFMPQAPAANAPCSASPEDRAALEEAWPRLKRAGLHAGLFLESDMDGRSYVSRAQLAMLMVRMLGWDAEAGQVTEQSPFADVPADHWAARYITLAWQAGIITGEPGGTFSPGRRATMAEAELVLARALRLLPHLTLENARQALTQAGISTEVSCRGEEKVDGWQYLLIIDRAMSVPLYGRFAATDDALRRMLA